MGQITSAFLDHAAKAVQILWGLLPKERNIESFQIITKETIKVQDIESYFLKKRCYAL